MRAKVLNLQNNKVHPKGMINCKAKEGGLGQKKSFLGKKEVIVVVFAIVLTTLGIKASDTFMGDNSLNKAGVGLCPEGMVLIPFAKGDFCLDIYEASARDDCSYSEPTNQTETRMNLDDPSCAPVSLAGNLPWRNISQDQASRACAKAGKRLASNQEWLQASQGTPDLSSDWDTSDCHVANNWETQPGPSGTSKVCVSSFGAYDMIGNVWEWVEGVVKDGVFEGEELPVAGYIDSTNGQGIPGETNANEPNPDYNNDHFWLKAKGLRGMVRGGYWNNKSDAGVYALYAVTPPSSAEPGIGFRCVK